MSCLPPDLQHLLYQFAGPWTLKAALIAAYDYHAFNFSQEEKWDACILNYDSCLNRGDLTLSFMFDFMVHPLRSRICLTVLHERTEWPGQCDTEAHFDFWSLDEIVDFLPKIVTLLPKGVFVREKLLIEIEPEEDYIHYPEDYNLPSHDFFSVSSYAEVVSRFFSA